MSLRVKICGLTTPEAIEAAKEADFAGFIFYPPSPRYLTPAKAAQLAENLRIPAVAVVVDPEDDLLQEISVTLKPNYLQLHGAETPARVREIRANFGISVIKAFRVASKEDMAGADAFGDSVDMLLFDARHPKATLPGGTGIAFDWKILAGQKFSKPWFLSGGLTVDNVEEAVHISGAKMVDVSSSLESSPGIKDPKLVREFVTKVKSIHS